VEEVADMHDGNSDPDAAAWRAVVPVTRRALLGLTAAASLVTVLDARPASAAPGGELSERQRGAILAVAGALAVFPVAFPVCRGARPATVREMPSRILALPHRLTHPRLALVARGADALDSAGVTGRPPAGTVALLSARAGHADAALTAVTAAAAATLADPFDADTDGFAANWLGILARMRDAGTLTAALARRDLA
jgi:hypothetical protein